MVEEVQLEDFSRSLSAIKGATPVVPLRSAVMDSLAILGIHGAYFVAPLTADPRIGRLLTVLGLSAIWERHYRAQLAQFDPLPNFSLLQSGAFSWPEATDSAKMSARQRRYLKIISRFGMARGIGVACYGPHGRSGFLGVAWPFDEAPQERTLQAVHAVGQASFQRYCQLIRYDGMVPTLSRRELEVLSWMCEGKSNSVIAQILEISRSSVDVYVRRIFAKLEVGDRTAACIKAYTFGLATSLDYKTLVAEAQKRRPGDAI